MVKKDRYERTSGGKKREGRTGGGAPPEVTPDKGGKGGRGRVVGRRR